MQVLRGVVQFLIYGIEREWDEYLSILFQSGSFSLSGSWNDLCFREIYSSIIFYRFIGSGVETRIVFDLPPPVCLAFILLYLIFCATVMIYSFAVIYIYIHERKRERERKNNLRKRDDTNFNFNFSVQFFC